MVSNHLLSVILTTLYPLTLWLVSHTSMAGAFHLSRPTSSVRPFPFGEGDYDENRSVRMRKRPTTLVAPITAPPLRISFDGSDGGSSPAGTSVSLPRDVKEAVAMCRRATQEALKGRLSRLDVEFPVGAKFGVEKAPSPKGRRSAAAPPPAGDGGPTRAVLDRSDRELARLFVEMFQPVGGENIVVAFVDEASADAARQNWKGDSGAASRVVAMNRRRGAKSDKARRDSKKAKGLGFAARLAAEVEDIDVGQPMGGAFELPQGTEVALFVAPGPKELVVIEKICNQVGMGTLVVLLNARLSKVTNFGSDAAAKLFNEEFIPVFSLAAAPQDEAPGCLLYRAFPGDWILARKPKVGQPKPILTQTTRPTNEECRQAFDQLEIGDWEKNVEGFVENVSGWFR